MQALNKAKLPPLGVAIARGNLKAVQALVACGAELYFNIDDKTHFNAVIEAVRIGRADILEFILNNGGGVYVNAPPDEGNPSCLFLAIVQGKDWLAGLLLEAGAFLSREEGKDSMTPLQYAARLGGAGIVQKLYERGASLDQPQSVTGMTALHYAALHGHYRVVDYLLEQGADPHALNAEGMTPLMVAASSAMPSTSTMARLLDGGANPNHKRSGGSQETALHMAAALGHGDAATVLLQYLADPLLTDVFNRTAARVARSTPHTMLAIKLENAVVDAEQAFFEKAYKPPRHGGQ